MSCFASGTIISTKDGDLPVEKLRVGDLVMTRDSGYQPIRRICGKRMTGRYLLDNPHLRPVLVQAGAFDTAMPNRDMMMTPNMRLPIEGQNTGFLGRDKEDRVAIKFMVNHDTIQQVDTIGTDYFLVLLDNHEVVAANGIWVECFNPNDTSLNHLGNAQKVEIFEIFPEVKVTRQPRRDGGEARFVVNAKQLRRRAG